MAIKEEKRVELPAPPPLTYEQCVTSAQAIAAICANLGSDPPSSRMQAILLAKAAELEPDRDPQANPDREAERAGGMRSDAPGARDERGRDERGDYEREAGRNFPPQR